MNRWQDLGYHFQSLLEPELFFVKLKEIPKEMPVRAGADENSFVSSSNINFYSARFGLVLWSGSRLCSLLQLVKHWKAWSTHKHSSSTMDHADFQGNKLVKKFYELKRSSLSHELYQEFLRARAAFPFSLWISLFHELSFAIILWDSKGTRAKLKERHAIPGLANSGISVKQSSISQDLCSL